MEIQTQQAAVPISLTRGVDVNKVEKELKALWSKDAEAGGVTRATTMNLVVYADHTENREEISDMLTVVNGSHPGRVVLLVANREADAPRLSAEASVRCRALGAKQIVCGEQVTIEADGSALATVNTAIAPLLLPDSPVFLWWKDIPHYDDRLFNALADLADRIVIDSATFDNPHGDTQRLTEVLQAHREFGYFSDLNWGRLTAWRTLLASFWDVADCCGQLDHITRVTVEYDPPDSNKSEIAAQALLVVGWLASRLGWEVVKGEKGAETAQFTLRSGTREIAVEIRPDKEYEGNDALLTSITLAGEGASFSVAYDPEGPKLKTTANIDGVRNTTRVLAYEQKSAAKRLSREMGILQRDTVYEAALGVVAELLKTLK